MRAVREAKGLSQRELATAAGCNANTIAKLERGEQEPAWPLVLALAKALDRGLHRVQRATAAGRGAVSRSEAGDEEAEGEGEEVRRPPIRETRNRGMGGGTSVATAQRIFSCRRHNAWIA